MDSVIYTDIINKVMTPFVRKTFAGDVQLHQDNDPKHNSIKCRAALDYADINWVINTKRLKKFLFIKF
jgi:hypothetical protein